MEQPNSASVQKVGQEAIVRRFACPAYPCSNGGTCSHDKNQVTCLCPAGFEGVLCDTSITSDHNDNNNETESGYQNGK